LKMELSREALVSFIVPVIMIEWKTLNNVF
jgi:hypothetical protein